jgi:uncharacterized protein YycO
MRVIFYRASSGDYWDKLVAMWTNGLYSHCELMFSDGMCFSSSSRDGGVRFKQIIIYPTHWDIIDVPTEKEKDIRNWCSTQIGMKYDWLGILGLAIKMPFQNRKKWYCSEICITALNLSEVIHMNSRTNPNKFFTLLSSMFLK